jgi:hypothetical protein
MKRSIRITRVEEALARARHVDDRGRPVYTSDEKRTRVVQLLMKSRYGVAPGACEAAEHDLVPMMREAIAADHFATMAAQAEAAGDLERARRWRRADELARRIAPAQHASGQPPEPSGGAGDRDTDDERRHTP